MLFWATRTTTWCCIRNSAVFEPDDGAELTHRLLAFARQQVLEPKETHVNDLIEANSGEDALVSIKKNKNIDLMFSDIIMPGGMSGRQLASIINTEYPKIKIQLTTGYENVDVTKNSADADFPLLRKPYDQQGLATALRKLLDGSGENTGFSKPDLPL